MDFEIFELHAPGFITIYQAVVRLAQYHKIEIEECEGICLEAALTHPQNIEKATRLAASTLHAHRRQRLGTRPIDENSDGDDEPTGVEMNWDHQNGAAFVSIFNLNEDGEYVGEYVGDDAAPGDQEEFKYEGPTLPDVTPHDTMTSVIYWAGCGADVQQIAARIGITKERVGQLLNDTKAILAAVHSTQMELDMPEFPKTPPFPRERRHYGARTARAVVEQQAVLEMGAHSI